MKTNPQVSQITQMVRLEGASVSCKEYQTDASRLPLVRLCNLRSLRRESAWELL